MYELAGSDARDDSAMGTPVVQGRTGEVCGGGNFRVWAGRITDPFYIDLGQPATVNTAFKNGAKLDSSAWRADKATNSFAGTTVESIVIEVSQDEPLLRDGTEIGVWCRTLLATDAGGWRQINRAGHPMMWPSFWPPTPISTRQRAAPGQISRRMVRDRVGGGGGRGGDGTAPDPQSYGWAWHGSSIPTLSYTVGTAANYGFAAARRAMADNRPR